MNFSAWYFPSLAALILYGAWGIGEQGPLILLIPYPLPFIQV